MHGVVPRTRRQCLALGLLLGWSSLGWAENAMLSQSPSYRLQPTTLDASGAPGTSTSRRADGSLGQEVAVGTSASPHFIVQSGFWGFLGNTLVPVVLTVNRTPAQPGSVDLSWSGNNTPYTLYRAPSCAAIFSNALGETSDNVYTDGSAPTNGLACYNVLAFAPGPAPPPPGSSSTVDEPNALGSAARGQRTFEGGTSRAARPRRLAGRRIRVGGRVSSVINYQGRLTDNTPSAESHRRHSHDRFFGLGLRVRGESLWSETQSVPVVNGLFNVLLGRPHRSRPASSPPERRVTSRFTSRARRSARDSGSPPRHSPTRRRAPMTPLRLADSERARISAASRLPAPPALRSTR